MHRDKLLAFDTGTIDFATGGAANRFTPSIDLLAHRDIGEGRPMFVRVTPAVFTVTGGLGNYNTVSLAFQLRGYNSPLVLKDSTAVTCTATSPGVVTLNPCPPLGTEIMFNGGTQPTGTLLNTSYYVVPVSGTTFNISTTLAGALASPPTGLVNFSSTGTAPTIAQPNVMLGHAMRADGAQTESFNGVYFSNWAATSVGAALQDTARPAFVPITFPVIPRPGPAMSTFDPTGTVQGGPPLGAFPSGSRYASMYLTVSGANLASAKFHMELCQIVDDGFKFYRPGVLHGIA